MVLHADFRFEPRCLLAAGASSFFFSFLDQDRTCSACDLSHVFSNPPLVSASAFWLHSLFSLFLFLLFIFLFLFFFIILD